MMKYVTFSNVAGYNVTGHYDSNIHNEIPAGAIEITDAQWQLSLRQKLRVDPDTLVAAEYIMPAADQLAAAAEAQVDIINSAFDSVVTGSVECTAGDLTLNMDAGYDSATKLDDGITLAARLGETTITITDYNNVDHTGISLDDALTISTTQAAHYAQARLTRNALRTAINAVEIGDGTLDAAIAAVQAITWPEE